MENKGNILTQLAIISDLLEKSNMMPENTVVRFNLGDQEYSRLLKIMIEKTKIKVNQVDDTFNVEIGTVSFVFSKSSA